MLKTEFTSGILANVGTINGKSSKMTIEAKSSLIMAIISNLKFAASNQKKAFDEGDTFFSLAFKTDAELKKIAKLAGV